MSYHLIDIKNAIECYQQEYDENAKFIEQLLARNADMLSALEMVLAKAELTCEVHDAVTRAIIKAKGEFKW